MKIKDLLLTAVGTYVATVTCYLGFQKVMQIKADKDYLSIIETEVPAPTKKHYVRVETPVEKEAVEAPVNGYDVCPEEQ